MLFDKPDIESGSSMSMAWTISKLSSLLGVIELRWLWEYIIFKFISLVIFINRNIGEYRLETNSLILRCPYIPKTG